NLTITAVSSNPALIPNSGTGALAASYTSPNATGSLSFTPLPNASGTAVVLVTVSDDGGIANSGLFTVTQALTITVTPVNQHPTPPPAPTPPRPPPAGPGPPRRATPPPTRPARSPPRRCPPPAARRSPSSP